MWPYINTLGIVLILVITLYNSYQIRKQNMVTQANLDDIATALNNLASKVPTIPDTSTLDLSGVNTAVTNLTTAIDAKIPPVTPPAE